LIKTLTRIETKTKKTGATDMKKTILLLFVFMAFSYNALYAQDFMDFVEEVRGDTLVILSLNDTGDVNTLIDVIELDSDAPDGRVYELKRGHSYLQDRGPLNLPSDRKTRIAGQDMGAIVTEDGDRPPRIAGAVDAEGSPQNFNFMAVQSDFELKNLAVQVAANDGTEAWFAFEMTGDDLDVTFDNVLLEHNTWTFIQSNNGVNNSLTIRDSYILNMTGVETRRNGGVYDSENEALRKLVVENSTHLQAAGMMYKFRNHPADSVFINRNTFVNATGQLFTSFGYEYNMAVTNNLFVNSNVQAYYPGLDVNETDQDFLPHGIINIAPIPDGSGIGVPAEERRVYVGNNGVFWDERLDTIVETLNAENVPCPDAEGPSNCQPDGEWMTQMITMNSRTQDIFDNDDQYPLINEENWVMAGDPDFTDHGGLMTWAVDEVINWSINTAGPGNDVLMGKWRSEGNEAETGVAANFLNFDWPVAADLSYSNSAYLEAGFNGFPIGDINWFPAQKAAWEAQREEEYAAIARALNEGELFVSNERIADIPTTVKLNQNYPNPFNPSTVIQYELAQAADVSIEVFDAAGRRVATLVNNAFQQSGTHSVRFDAGNLSSGVYFYQLTAGNHVLTGKMTLIK